MESLPKSTVKKPKEFTFAAGEMIVENNKAKPNPDKGEIRIYINPDGILCLEWKNLVKNTISDPIAIIKDEWKWQKVDSKKGRVYLLKSTEYDDEKYFYWLQYPKSMDNSIMTIVNNIITTGELIIDENKEVSQFEPMSVDDIVKDENKTDANNTNTNNNTNKNTNNTNNNTNNNNTNNNNQQTNPPGNNNNFNMMNMLKSFQDALKKTQKLYPELQQILTRVNVTELINSLDENTKNELIKLLPANQQTMQGLIDNVSSAQFQQALEQLSVALNSENFTAVISSFGLNIKDCQTCMNGVEGFIKCILSKFPKKE